MTKLLVLNPSPGNLDEVLRKANHQHSTKGPFEAVLLLGDVVSDQPPKEEVVPKSYFTNGSGIAKETSLPQNLIHQPDFSRVTLDSGITIQFVSMASESEPTEVASSDILITYNWPKAIADMEKLTLVGNKHVDEIVKKVKPRYHFCVGSENGRHFECRPFEWSTGRVTRFVSLGQEGSGSKWFYAFNIDKEEKAVAGLGINPFTQVPEASLERLGEPPAKRARVAVTPDVCFFCLSNPNVETHMIISLSKQSYLTIAKGPLTVPGKGLPFAGHLIITPIQHVPVVESSEVKAEIDQYQDSLVRAFAEKEPGYTLVSYEISRQQNVHFHVQILPIPSDLVDRFEECLHEKAKYNNEHFSRNHPLEFKTDISSQSEHIKFNVFGKTKRTYVAVLSNPELPVDLQFPRRVLASTLKLGKRVKWDRCKESREKEAQECEKMKVFLKDYQCK